MPNNSECPVCSGLGADMNINFTETPKQSFVVFMRHAERPDILKGDTGNELVLTDAGRESALEFGRVLGPNLRSLYSSPIIRCLDTAKWIGEASGHKLPVIESTALGDPGPYVQDKKIAWDNWLLHGSEKILDDLMADDKSPPGLHSVQYGTDVLLRYFHQLLNSEAGYHICVSHDIVMLPFLSCLLDKPLSGIEWPGFLQAILLNYEDNKLVIRYKTHHARLPVAC